MIKKQEKKRDIEAKLFMLILHLKEEKKKEYSFEECEKRIAYVFNNYDEFKSYFVNNGFADISGDLLELCRMQTTRQGTIIALKALCDYTIKKYKMNKQLTQAQIDEIHSRCKLTPKEKVEEWESWGLCAPGDAVGSASNRCRAFANCHDCMVEFASSYEEIDKIELQLVNTEEKNQSGPRLVKKDNYI